MHPNKLQIGLAFGEFNLLRDLMLVLVRRSGALHASDADAHWDAASQGARSASQCLDALGMTHPNVQPIPAKISQLDAK